MPIKVSPVTAGGEIHPNPFVGPINHTASVRVDVSVMTNTVVDSRGYLKPGTLLTRTGTLIGAAGLKYGAVVEATRIHTDNTTLAAVTVDVDVAVALICCINRAILEDSLGRVLNADELANPAGSSPIVLIY